MSDQNANTGAIIEDTYRNKRQMTWLFAWSIQAFSIAFLIVLVFANVDATKLSLLSTLMQWYFSIAGGIVATFLGVTTFLLKGTLNGPSQ